MAANSTTALALDNPFWRFALNTYRQPGVEAICLELQCQGLSINRLLYCLWLAGQGRGLPAETDLADRWQQQISHPLRALRYQVRGMKADQPELADCYRKMREAELACEQVEIARLYQQAEQGAPLDSPSHALRQNLNRYLQQVGVPLADVQQNLQALLVALGLEWPGSPSV
ncbi:TIGR02444 family protein [Marinobacterium arenosum]|uniref:TIGR02444 family protein n=1 Tax=Marinobacterium arenosum TaxID=2862496 RepID=UPI001C9546BD|nr:TIGR02444 family protein [Marinobacterium arenosum]MBY4675514.1 TIGR02444 family protein [Marinobacterium arenosum]